MSRPGLSAYRISVASYLLDALPPGERREVDLHVRDCPECQAELINLAGLPGLLNRLRAWRRECGFNVEL